MFYAAYNTRGAHGLAPSDVVRAFETKKARDEFVATMRQKNPTIRALYRHQVTGAVWEEPIVARVDSEFYGVIRDDDGALYVEATWRGDARLVRKFYKGRRK
jgi:hypothetical protein